MRLSCNGCRVLRKGCSGECPIRPCLQWIKSPQSQANATLFLAKFYGRAGLINLINAAAPDLRAATFKSLLQEACGRIVNPIFGCSGLLSSGRWELCQAAVEAVLSGAPITQLQLLSSSESPSMLKACDIRHVSNKGKGLHKVKSRSNQFKRSSGNNINKVATAGITDDSASASGVSEHVSVGNSADADSSSVATVEAGPTSDDHQPDLDLNLALGFSAAQPHKTHNSRRLLGFLL